MNRTSLSFGAIAVAIATAVVIIGATSGRAAKQATQASTTTAPAASILSVKQSSLGGTLVDANGRVLYLFKADKSDQSVLSVAGRAIWPPLTSSAKPAAGAGVSGSEIGLIKGAGGTRQVAYNGHPLYYYVGDHGAGQANGQGLNQFGALWYVLSPAGVAITAPRTAPAPAPSTSAGSSGSGYGY